MDFDHRPISDEDFKKLIDGEVQLSVFQIHPLLARVELEIERRERLRGTLLTKFRALEIRMATALEEVTLWEDGSRPIDIEKVKRLLVPPENSLLEIVKPTEQERRRCIKDLE